MTILDLLLLGLATWRMAALLVKEEGPWHIFHRIREGVGIKHAQDGSFGIISDTWLAGVLSCVWCTSIYIGTFWTILYLLFPEITIYLTIPFALSALAILIDSIIGERNRV